MPPWIAWYGNAHTGDVNIASCRKPPRRFPLKSITFAPENIAVAALRATSRFPASIATATRGRTYRVIDPKTDKMTKLFHPRRHKWPYDFRYEGGTLIGRTAIGRTTIDVLRINLPNLVAIRELLLEDGAF